MTHWWEYFRDGVPDEKFIAVLHQVADYLASQPDICVTTFRALAEHARPATAKPGDWQAPVVAVK